LRAMTRIVQGRERISSRGDPVNMPFMHQHRRDPLVGSGSGRPGDQRVLALILGSLVAVLLFIPVAAVQYRRDGRALVLLAGKTIGELVVDLRTVPASMSRRLVKLLVGVVPLVTLAVRDDPLAQLAVLGPACVAVSGAFVTSGHRGVANSAAGLRLEIDDS
jgi:hypothetical protein